MHVVICRRQQLGVIVLAMAITCVSGCGADPVRADQSLPRPIERLTFLYADYVAIYGRGPKDIEEFKRFLNNEGRTKVHKKRKRAATKAAAKVAKSGGRA